MFYFLQIIELKNRKGQFVFLRESDENLTFINENEQMTISKSDFKKEEVTELYETVKLFGKVPIKRVLRAIK
jgi:hypothetical protein